MLFSEVGEKTEDKGMIEEVPPTASAQTQAASLPRSKKSGKRHKKSNSLDSLGILGEGLDLCSEQDDDISDTDNEDEWEKERLPYPNSAASPSLRRHHHAKGTTTLVW